MWKEAERHGKGKEIKLNGDSYDGEWVEDSKHGYGVLTYTASKKRSNHWNKDRIINRSDFESGVIYTGMFVKNRLHGQGTATWTDGKKYTGMWKNSLKHGKGKEIKANGDEYDGEWENDLPHGYGIRKFKDGRKWEGTWKKGQMVGEGTIYIPINIKKSTCSLPKI